MSGSQPEAGSAPGAVHKEHLGRGARLLRLVGSVLDPRAWLHMVRIVNYYNYSHVQPMRRIAPGPGCAISPNAFFANPDQIAIGARVRISARCHIWAGPSARGRITLSDDVMIAPEVMITAANYRFNEGSPVSDQPMDEADIFIGRDVWIGYGAVVLPGAHIGDGAIIGAGSVVRGRVEPRAIIAAAQASIPIGRRLIPGDAGGAAPLAGTGINAGANAAIAALVARETPDFSAERRAGSIEASGIDSFDLMTLRTAIEAAAGATIPDAEWAGLTSLDDIARLPSLTGAQAQKAAQKTAGAAPPVPARGEIAISEHAHLLPKGAVPSMVESREPGRIHRRHLLEMPKMAMRGLGESWLFRELNDLHWTLICDFLQSPSSEIADDLGDRLYATITRCRIDMEPSLRGFQENTPFTIDAQLERYGASVFFSRNTFTGEGGVRGETRVMSTFAKYGERGKNTSLIKGVPTLPDPDSVPSMDKIDAFGFDYRARRAQEPWADVLFECEYEILPPHDINGVGLLYFAAYPTVYDLCLERAEGKGFLNAHSTVSKDLFYFANSEPDETLIFKVHSREEIAPDLIRHTCSLSRKSDGKRMGEVISIKRRMA